MRKDSLLSPVACQNDYGESVPQKRSRLGPPGVFLEATFLPGLLCMFGPFVLRGIFCISYRESPSLVAKKVF